MTFRIAVTISENVTKMHLFSAYEDFVGETLLSIPTHLGRLQYFRRLRHGSGYFHSGLERVYGESAAQSAVWRAHHELITELLRKPLRTWHENAVSDEDENFGELLDDYGKLLPRDVSRSQELHFKSVLLALSHLCRKHATDRAA
jgi:hypothetical protein